jgi:hypothetical protein
MKSAVSDLCIFLFHKHTNIHWHQNTPNQGTKHEIRIAAKRKTHKEDHDTQYITLQ